MNVLRSVRTYRGGAAQRWQRLSGNGKGARDSLTAPFNRGIRSPATRYSALLDLEPQRHGDDVGAGAVLGREDGTGAGGMEELDELVDGLKQLQGIQSVNRFDTEETKK